MAMLQHPEVLQLMQAQQSQNTQQQGQVSQLAALNAIAQQALQSTNGQPQSATLSSGSNNPANGQQEASAEFLNNMIEQLKNGDGDKQAQIFKDLQQAGNTGNSTTTDQNGYPEQQQMTQTAEQFEALRQQQAQLMNPGITPEMLMMQMHSNDLMISQQDGTGSASNEPGSGSGSVQGNQSGSAPYTTDVTGTVTPSIPQQYAVMDGATLVSLVGADQTTLVSLVGADQMGVPVQQAVLIDGMGKQPSSDGIVFRLKNTSLT